MDALLEEKSLYWNDDKEIVDTFVLKTIKRFDPINKSKQELLPEYKDEEDKDFARKLFRATILNADQYQRYMSENSRNWDFSRLAYMDVVIMQIAIAEMLTFPNIPVSVTIKMMKAMPEPRVRKFIVDTEKKEDVKGEQKEKQVLNDVEETLQKPVTQGEEPLSTVETPRSSEE